MSIQCQDSRADTDNGDALDMTVFGTRLREWRKRAKLSQKQLATASGLRQPSLSAIENGETKAETLRAGNLIRMARALQVSAEELYTGRAPIADAKRGALQDRVLRLLALMNSSSIDAWLENGATLIRHQGPVILAEGEKKLHTTDAPKKKNIVLRKGITTESELVAVHGRQEADRIIAGEVERDEARAKNGVADLTKRPGKQPRRFRGVKAK